MASSSYAPTEEEGFVAPCWCGETNAFFSDLFSRGCAGTGYLDCLCGGDFCCCHHHGGTECMGCEDCEDIRADGFEEIE